MSGSYAHDFFSVIEHHNSQEADRQEPERVVTTHPLEQDERGGKNAPTDLYQLHKYDYLPRYRQYNLNEEGDVMKLEKQQAKILRGEGILRAEKSATSPKGDFIIMLSWLERKEKTKKPTE